MTRADMGTPPVRQDWMTDELIEKIRAVSKDAKISCGAARQLASDSGIDLHRMKPLLDYLGLKVTSCQLGCF